MTWSKSTNTNAPTTARQFNCAKPSAAAPARATPAPPRSRITPGRPGRPPRNATAVKLARWPMPRSRACARRSSFSSASLAPNAATPRAATLPKPPNARALSSKASSNARANPKAARSWSGAHSQAAPASPRPAARRLPTTLGADGQPTSSAARRTSAWSPPSLRLACASSTRNASRAASAAMIAADIEQNAYVNGLLE